LALQTLPSDVKNDALEAIADGLSERAAEVLEANAADMLDAREGEHTSAFLDKLRLDEARVAAMVVGVRQIAALSDPVGEVIEGFRLPNGLEVRKVRVPLGVIALVYEARPNVTIDATALCLKSGNAVVLRGSSAARRSNAALADIATAAASCTGLPEDAVTLLQGGRAEIAELATQTGLIDLIVPRGGEGLKAALKGVATVPVIYAASGNCHVYVDRSADLEQARAIVLNAKVHRPGVCNAAETVLVHAEIAARFLPEALAALSEAGVCSTATIGPAPLRPLPS
jgi:glutamate-5-semialdehyde dehydrogenase